MKILVEYIIIGDEFPVQEVSEAIGIKDCEIVKTGDVVYYGENNKGYRVETDTSITYTTGYIDTIDMRLPVDIMTDMLSEKKNIIKYYIEKYSLESKFWITLCLSDNPIMMMSERFIKLAADLNAFVEFDTYLDYDEDERVILNAT